GQPVAGYITGTDIGIDPELVNSTTVEDPMPFSTSVAVAVVSEGTAEVTLGAGVTILASHDVTLSAHPQAKVDITTLTRGFGFTFGQAAPDATVALANGASITAANDFHMNASTNTDLKVTAFVPGVGVSTNLSGSGAIMHANSLADVGLGASIAANNAD